MYTFRVDEAREKIAHFGRVKIDNCTDKNREASFW